MNSFGNAVRSYGLILQSCKRSVRDKYFKWIEPTGWSFGWGSNPFPEIVVVGVESEENRLVRPLQDGRDIKSDGLLWAVPKKRKSVEVRSNGRFGFPQWVWKLYVPKTNLRICDTCGHHYEAMHLCRNCYEKVKTETAEIRKKMEAQFGDNPQDKDAVVLYEGENSRNLHKKETENRLIVELPKKRPQFFTKNLLQRSTAGPNSEVTILDRDTSTLYPR